MGVEGEIFSSFRR